MEEEYRPFKDCKELINHFRKIWKMARRFYEEYDLNLKIELPLIWVKNKNFGIKEMIIGFEEEVVFLHRTNLTMEDLFNDYTFLDGSPCGVLVLEA